MVKYSAQLLGLPFVTVHGPQSIIRRVHIYYSLSLPPTPLLKSSVTPVQMPPPHCYRVSFAVLTCESLTRLYLVTRQALCLLCSGWGGFSRHPCIHYLM